MKDVADQVDAWVKRGGLVALATVVSVRRSAPRPPGAKMAINDRGEIFGAISGGVGEGAVAPLDPGVDLVGDVLHLRSSPGSW